jgi:serine/threonine-protein kinase
MSGTSSSIRAQQQSPGMAPQGHGGLPGASERTPQVVGGVIPVQDNQPTIISRQPPIQPPERAADAASRLMQGKLLPGDMLGHYELLQFVGGGGMGRVFRALDTRLGRIVALKVLPPEQATDPDTRLRFQNEAQSAARLDHENIARVYHVGEDSGLQYIAFEFIEGVNIRTMIEQRGPLPLAEAIYYTVQVAEALAHAASRDVVHRDIKPSNILVTPDGRAKLIDLGLARLRQSDAAADLTASGVTLGTFDYISPEQARDPRSADVRSDLYSLGCTFYFMLTGRPPFPEGTVLQKLLQHQGDQPPDVRQLRPELPEDVNRVLRKLLAKDPRHRYATPGELIAELISLARLYGLPLAGAAGRYLASAAERKQSFTYRHFPWLCSAVALVLIVAALQVVWTLDAARDERPVVEQRTAAPFSLGAQGESAGTSGLEQPPVSPSVPDFNSQPRSSGAQPRPSELSGTQPQASEPSAKQSPKPTAPELPTSPKQSLHDVAEPATQAPTSPSKGVRDSPAVAAPGTGLAPTEAGLPGGLLVVDAIGGAPRRYATLERAVEAARKGEGNTIELRFNGPQESTKPIQLPNQRLTIRGGKGYSPVIAFRPSPAYAADNSVGMLSFAGERVTLVNLAVELNVPLEAAGQWTLVELSPGKTIELNKCWLTVRGPSAVASDIQQTALFRVKPRPDDKGTAAKPNGNVATITLEDCVARGEAALLHVDDAQPVQLIWRNGLLAVSEPLLRATGAGSEPTPSHLITITLRHLTAVLPQGVCAIETSIDQPYQLPIEVRCDDSILIGTAEHPLIRQTGKGSLQEMYRRIVWRGEGSFLEGFEDCWVIDDQQRQTPPTIIGYEQWAAMLKARGESPPARATLRWDQSALPRHGTPLYAVSPNNYRLLRTPDNPAIDAAVDGGNAGMEHESLPGAFGEDTTLPGSTPPPAPKPSGAGDSPTAVEWSASGPPPADKQPSSQLPDALGWE